MNQGTDHLRLLAIFHYVVAGLAALFSLFPLLYTMVGSIFIFAPRHGTPKQGEASPPEFLGWIFIALGLLLFLFGIAIVIRFSISARWLSRRKCLMFALVLASLAVL